MINIEIKMDEISALNKFMKVYVKKKKKSNLNTFLKLIPLICIKLELNYIRIITTYISMK